jgi:hypothetical protein
VVYQKASTTLFTTADPHYDQVDPSAAVSETYKTMATIALSALAINGPFKFLHFGHGAGTVVGFLAHLFYISTHHHLVVELDSGLGAAVNSILPPSSQPNVRIECGDALEIYGRRTDGTDEPFECVCVDVFDAILFGELHCFLEKGWRSIKVSMRAKCTVSLQMSSSVKGMARGGCCFPSRGHSESNKGDWDGCSRDKIQKAVRGSSNSAG